MHVAIIHRPTLAAFEDWCREVRPDELLFNGDTFDFAQLSAYPKGADSLACAIDEVVEGVSIINRLARHTGRIRIQEGNHCKRWEKTVIGANAQSLKGAIGLSLREQCQFQGLDPRVEWVRESAKTPGLWVTRDLVARHGDMQAGKYGGAVNLGTNRLSKNQGVSELVGHHHTAQLVYRTAWDRTSFVMTLPTMADDENYAPGTNWQRGWGALAMSGPPNGRSRRAPELVIQPSLVLVQRGLAMWGGQMFGRLIP